MNHVDIQRQSAAPGQPDDASLQRWTDLVLAEVPGDTEVVIRIVDHDESAALNSQFRQKKGPTNVLSFPFAAPDLPGVTWECPLLGDLVVCAPLLAQEAQSQGKPLAHHWAHIIIHGLLHLQGYDHLNDAEAEQMENQEIQLLQQLNIPNPYLGDQP